MAARRSWVVFVDDQSRLTGDDYIGGMYYPYKGNSEFLSVHFKESGAVEAAKILSQKYPGKDVHVFKQSHGFYCKPTQPETKVWDEAGRFIPAPSV